MPHSDGQSVAKTFYGIAIAVLIGAVKAVGTSLSGTFGDVQTELDAS